MQAKKCEQQCLVTGEAVNDEDLSAISAKNIPRIDVSGLAMMYFTEHGVCRLQKSCGASTCTG